MSLVNVGLTIEPVVRLDLDVDDEAFDCDDLLLKRRTFVAAPAAGRERGQLPDTAQLANLRRRLFRVCSRLKGSSKHNPVVAAKGAELIIFRVGLDGGLLQLESMGRHLDVCLGAASGDAPRRLMDIDDVVQDAGERAAVLSVSALEFQQTCSATEVVQRSLVVSITGIEVTPEVEGLRGQDGLDGFTGGDNEITCRARLPSGPLLSNASLYPSLHRFFH